MPYTSGFGTLTVRHAIKKCWNGHGMMMWYDVENDWYGHMACQNSWNDIEKGILMMVNWTCSKPPKSKQQWPHGARSQRKYVSKQTLNISNRFKYQEQNNLIYAYEDIPCICAISIFWIKWLKSLSCWCVPSPNACHSDFTTEISWLFTPGRFANILVHKDAAWGEATWQQLATRVPLATWPTYRHIDISDISGRGPRLPMPS